MNLHPIIIVEDDEEDCDFLTSALRKTGVQNEFRCFDTPMKALEYLTATSEIPLLIISDINMPHMNGLAFKKKINDNERLNSKRIPFVILSTSAADYLVDEAFHLCVQGYFQKPTDNNKLNEIAKHIIDYWLNSKLPQLIN